MSFEKNEVYATDCTIFAWPLTSKKIVRLWLRLSETASLRVGIFSLGKSFLEERVKV